MQSHRLIHFSFLIIGVIIRMSGKSSRFVFNFNANDFSNGDLYILYTILENTNCALYNIFRWLTFSLIIYWKRHHDIIRHKKYLMLLSKLTNLYHINETCLYACTQGFCVESRASIYCVVRLIANDSHLMYEIYLILFDFLCNVFFLIILMVSNQ